MCGSSGNDGGGSIGMLYGANAKPDGYTVTAVTVELTTLPHTGTGGGLEPEMFKPILMFNSSCSAITVKADAPWNTLDEFLDYAKTNDVQIGNSGIGAIWHLAAAGLAQKAGVDFTYVPFEGSTPAITSLLGGHIDAISVSYSEVIQQVQAGELKVLAVLADERLPYASEIPTAKELGYDVSIGTWRGLSVPKDTPDEVVGKLYEIFSKAVEKESFKSFMGETKIDQRGHRYASGNCWGGQHHGLYEVYVRQGIPFGRYFLYSRHDWPVCGIADFHISGECL